MTHLPQSGRVTRLLLALPRHTIVVPMFIATLLIICVVLAWHLVKKDQQFWIAAETRGDLEYFTARLHTHVNTRLAVAKHVRNQWVNGHIPSHDEFLAQANSIHMLFGDFQAINWIDPNGIIQWVSPVIGNQAAIGLDISELEIPSIALKAAKQTRNVQLTPPIRLAQGLDGFVAYIPIGYEGTDYGFLNIVFRTAPMIKYAAKNDMLNAYHFTIKDDEKLIYNSATNVNEDTQAFHKSLNIANRQWEVTAIPTDETIASLSNYLDEMVLITGISLALILCYLIHLAMVRQQIAHATDRLFGTFIENSPSAILIKDVKGNFLHANSRWHEWFNPEGLDISIKKDSDLFSAEHLEAVHKQDKKVIATLRPADLEILSPLADGTKRPTLLQKFPILDANGKIIAVGGMNTDISTRIQSEEKLKLALLKSKTASQSKSKFLATMSHELRTPLNAIIGFSDILVGQYFGKIGNEKYVEYAKDIHNSGKHLLSLIDNVLDISSIELGKRDLVFEAIAIDQMLADCVKSVMQRAKSNGIDLFLKASSTLPEIHADKTALKQIVLNLLTNAIKFSYSGDKIFLTAEATPENIIITVRDTGTGIDNNVLKTITEPFFKGHKDSDVAHEGVGLGLSIVKSLVAAHKGTLDIQSEVGSGTSVSVTFPKIHNRIAA